MSSSKDRQRAAARARLEREIAARAAEQSRRRKRTGLIAGSVAAGVLVIVLVIVLITSGGGGKKKVTAQATPSASTTKVSCVWNSATNPSPAPSGASPSPKPSPNPYLKNVGTPATSGMPNSGTQTMTITTNQGPITVSVDDAKAPCAAASFTYLAGKKFFDNTSCYRMHNTGYYILQCGDPSGTGKGGPAYTYTAENQPTDSRPTYTTGMVAVGTPPTAGDNGSQFFIVYKNTEDDPSQTQTATSILPGQFTVLGTITAGMDVVQKVAAGGLTPAGKSDPNTGKPKIPLAISSLTMSAGTSSGS
ncbi:MAG TPA: peptidylprolyl isomerase [Rugosimonospora sp.]|nr:peptidylprolyl isomerase [Rugosimonospora sp.]